MSNGRHHGAAVELGLHQVILRDLEFGFVLLEDFLADCLLFEKLLGSFELALGVFALVACAKHAGELAGVELDQGGVDLGASAWMLLTLNSCMTGTGSPARVASNSKARQVSSRSRR